THLRGDLFEAGLSCELAPRGGSAPRFGDRSIGLRAFEGYTGWRLAPCGAATFPAAWSSRSPNTWYHSSVTTDSGLRDNPSRSRNRPDRATIALSRPTSKA